MTRRQRTTLPLIALSAALLAASGAWADPTKDLIVHCKDTCAAVTTAIEQIPGARINYIYENVAGLAVTLPTDAVDAIEARSDVQNVSKDLLVAAPQPPELVPLAAEGDLPLDPATLPELSGGVLPASYNVNNNQTGAAVLHAEGKIGSVVVVGVIDSGTANAPTVPALAGTVIGGENFVPLAQDPVASATSRLNDSHGTFVGCMIAAHANFLFNNASILVRSLNIHSPESVIPCTLLGCPANLSVVPMIGSAPGSRIYAFKVFPSGGGGAPTSRILAAMDRAITQRRNFNDGMPSAPINPGCGTENNPCVFDSLNIQVVNMSLGGLTFFAGRDLEDELARDMQDVGITLVTAAGNDGPAALTVSSPATAFNALTVASANTAPNERVLRDVQFGLGIGSLWRPTSHIQTTTSSSRGPTADGRYGIGTTAPGFAIYVQGPTGGISLASGTSFASPTVAGGAAVLRGLFPTAQAVQIRNAIVDSSNPALIADGSGTIDRGAGFLNLPAAEDLLAGTVRTNLPAGLSIFDVAINLLPLGIKPVTFKQNKFNTKVQNLAPGKVTQFYVRTLENVDSLTISLKNLTPALPPASQNQLFGDDVFLTIVDVFTSVDAPLFQNFVAADTTFTINKPQAGLIRVAVQGDSTNAGAITADLTIERTTVNLGLPTAVGLVGEGEEDVVRVNVPAGKAELSFLLSWLHDWGGYPTNDVDLVLEDPNGAVINTGSTLSSPERVTIANPIPGVWTARVVGFLLHEEGQIIDSEPWSLRAKADGARLSPLH